MGVFVDIIEELRTRFANELGSGNILEAIKTVYVGSRQDVNFDLDYPILILDFKDLEEIYSGQERKAGTIGIVVSVVDKLTDEKAGNLLYNTGEGTGIIFLLEKVLDVANSDSSGNFDPRLAQNSFQSMQVSIGPVKKLSEAFLQAQILLELKPKEFIGNQRS